jgi:propionyl-CoA synthetase
VRWIGDLLRVPVVDHWWQTETGWPITANPVGIEALEIPSGSPGVPMPGYDLRVLDEGGHEVPAGSLGAIALRLPLPPGCLPTLWGADERFRRAYLDHFPGFYETGDAGMVDEGGHVFILARTDDVINVAGHRLSTGAMEEVICEHPEVAECAVVGMEDALKGQLPVGFLCLNRGTARGHGEVAAECVALIRERIGPVAAFRTAVVVERLPKTRSGKILRATMGQIAAGREVRVPATIDDPTILDEIGERLRAAGLAGG